MWKISFAEKGSIRNPIGNVKVKAGKTLNEAIQAANGIGQKVASNLSGGEKVFALGERRSGQNNSHCFRSPNAKCCKGGKRKCAKT